MRYVFWPTAAIAALLSIALPAQAMPLPASSVASDSGITRVRDGCGPFGHRSHYGYCKENGDSGYAYDPGEYRRDGYGGYGYGRGPRFYEGGYGERRCFIRETYEGPIRVCR
ncbi:GCG_CRPN prefix-to-repeats domain-containing protein [Lichenifustis flavocetrariae]|uniref:Uncharacterized protein n=1 Tax=Lichenifustis flavocetrariae TaxID=2949735 RepID=A0AA41Z2X8_9HYPH|nr:hypothetical protein [Lichenifustis flavocetrariae]MCW6513229.1 hypothetical protein [Lichenifustis flavocetrariae]